MDVSEKLDTGIAWKRLQSISKDIEVFEIMGKNICFCIPTCAFCEIDHACYTMLDGLIGGVSFHDIASKMRNEFDLTPPEEVLAELDDLVNAGLLLGEGEHKFNGANRTPVVSALALIMATDCNLRCDYCYAEGGTYQHKRELMSVSVAKSSIDFLLKHSRRSKEVGISFFGGEPMLNYSCIKEVVPYALEQFRLKGKECSFGITTNGLLLTPENVEFMMSCKFSFIISIDGPAKVHDKYRFFPNRKGSYDSIVKNLEKLVAVFPDLYDKVTIRATFTGEDHNMIDCLSHLRDLGFKKIALESCSSTQKRLGIDKESLQHVLSDYNHTVEWYLEQLKSKNPFSFHHFTQLLEQVSSGTSRLTQCGAGIGYLSVSPEGVLYPCHRMVGNKDFAMGSVFDGADQEMQKLFGCLSVPFKEKCMNCWARYICGGGCHATAIQFNNDILDPYEIDCELMKHRIKLGAWLFSEMADHHDVYENVPLGC